VFGRSRAPVAAPADAAPASLTAGEGAATAAPATGLPSGEPAVVERPIPNIVSAAWELELLIAGAVTFALFQLPGSVEGLRNWLSVRVSGAGEFAMFMGLLYAKAIVYALIVAFVVNLSARAYWVGLVGLHSVFPRGVRWDQLGMGPVGRQQYRERIASLPAVMSRVDNFASVIFSFAFLIVACFLFSVLALSVTGGLAYLVSVTLFCGEHVSTMLYAWTGTIVGFLAIVGLLDKYVGARLDPSSASYRRLQRAVRVAAVASGMTILGPILLTLMSNVGRHRMMLLFYVALLVPLSIATLEFLGRLGALRGGLPLYVPEEADVRGVDVDHYETLRPRDALFVPYIASRHDPALATGCPGLQPMRSGRPYLRPLSSQGNRDSTAAVADRALACLQRIHALALDGTPRPDVPFRFYVHPSTGRDGLIAYIPTAGLAGGMHTLSVLPPPRGPRATNKAPLEPYDIVFWR
jgi:hypothetical protein